MTLEGVMAVQARIAAIQAKIGGTSAPPSSSRPASALRFADTLAVALAPGSEQIPRSAAASAPEAFAAHGNGQIPLDALVTIGNGSERLYGPAADAFRRMASDAWRAGIDLKVNDGYRDLATQQRLADELGLYRDGGKAAVPGTSDHGWGLSVDIDTDARTTAWLRRNAGRYGFVEDVPREPWHWTFRSGT